VKYIASAKLNPVDYFVRLAFTPESLARHRRENLASDKRKKYAYFDHRTSAVGFLENFLCSRSCSRVRVLVSLRYLYRAAGGAVSDPVPSMWRQSLLDKKPDLDLRHWVFIASGAACRDCRRPLVSGRFCRGFRENGHGTRGASHSCLDHLHYPERPSVELGAPAVERINQARRAPSRGRHDSALSLLRAGAERGRRR
jgi:hypothetical protein